MNLPRPATVLLAAAALCALPVIAAGAAPADAAPAPKPNGHVPHLVNLKNMNCEDFMGLEEGERTPVIFYMAGDEKMAGRTLAQFDLDLANRALPEVWAECKRKPQANLMYVVVAWFKAHKPPPPPKKKK
jgi:hypothetical protein